MVGWYRNCSSFADKYLDTLDEAELADYDTILNGPEDEWEKYYWCVGRQVRPLSSRVSCRYAYRPESHDHIDQTQAPAPVCALLAKTHRVGSTISLPH